VTGLPGMPPGSWGPRDRNPAGPILRLRSSPTIRGLAIVPRPLCRQRRAFRRLAIQSGRPPENDLPGSRRTTANNSVRLLTRPKNVSRECHPSTGGEHKLLCATGDWRDDYRCAPLARSARRSTGASCVRAGASTHLPRPPACNSEVINVPGPILRQNQKNYKFGVDTNRGTRSCASANSVSSRCMYRGVVEMFVCLNRWRPYSIPFSRRIVVPHSCRSPDRAVPRASCKWGCAAPASSFWRPFVLSVQ
jgi:hypothetical protein